MRHFTILVFLFICSNCLSQPGDPGGDPDSIGHHGPPGNPSGDPDANILNSFPKELVCDSIVTVNQNGKRYVVLFHRKSIVAVYRKEKIIKIGRGKNYSFY